MPSFKSILVKVSLNSDMDINDIVRLPLLEQNINITLLEPNGGEVFNVSDNVK